MLSTNKYSYLIILWPVVWGLGKERLWNREKEEKSHNDLSLDTEPSIPSIAVTFVVTPKPLSIINSVHFFLYSSLAYLILIRNRHLISLDKNYLKAVL